MIKSMDKRVAEFAEDILKKVEAKHPGFHLQAGMSFNERENCGCILGAICLAFGQDPDYRYTERAAQALAITYNEAIALEYGFMNYGLPLWLQTDRAIDLYNFGAAIRKALARD